VDHWAVSARNQQHPVPAGGNLLFPVAGATPGAFNLSPRNAQTRRRVSRSAAGVIRQEPPPPCYGHRGARGSP
jgi:hypothetical protein